MQGDLSDEDYNTNDPFIKNCIMEAMRMEMNGTQNVVGRKPQVSSQQVTLSGLKNSGERFKNITDNQTVEEEQDYEEDNVANMRRERMYDIIPPPLFKVVGYTQDGRTLRRKPIYRMSDLYLPPNSKVKNLVNSAFRKNIFGKRQRTQERTVISNANELEQIVANYQAAQEEYTFAQKGACMNENQLEEYIIDRGDSKDLYFLYETMTRPDPQQLFPTLRNNAVNSPTFLMDLQRDVTHLQRQYDKIDSQSSEECIEAVLSDVKEEGKDNRKEYFGKYITYAQRKKEKSNISVQREHTSVADKIIRQLQYYDPDILEEKYKRPAQENLRVEINLANPNFFLEKLHLVLDKNVPLLKPPDKKPSIMNRQLGELNDKSLPDGSVSAIQKRQFSGGSKDNDDDEVVEESRTVKELILAEMKSAYRNPIKHSQVASKFQFVRFTLQSHAFLSYHRHQFPFHEHLQQRQGVTLVPSKRFRVKPKGLVANVEMTDSHERFAKKQNISLSHGQFILVEYIEEVPLLMSNVGMCERLFNQVNFAEVVQKMQTDVIGEAELDAMEEGKGASLQKLPFEKQCGLWRKAIKELFGENGKQIYWDPKQVGKLIGTPEGYGVSCMDNNLFTAPVVRKPPPSRDFLLVREGKRWFLRRIEDQYVSGQIQPKMKVFCPGSRDFNLFKMGYVKSYVKRQLREYESLSFDQLKAVFKGETETSLKKALKAVGAETKDNKLYRAGMEGSGEGEVLAEQICLYERMQKGLCQLWDAGIQAIYSNEKIKHVLKQFNRKYHNSSQKYAIARMIREQLFLTSWYLTDSFLKYRNGTSKIQINGFADPTSGRGGYSYINKPQKERTSREDMEERAEKTTINATADLRKLNCKQSRQLLRGMGHNEDEIETKTRWELITYLRTKENTQFSRKERETKPKKMENEKKEISKNFNKLLKFLNDECQPPAFQYSRPDRSSLEYYIVKERENWEKFQRKLAKQQKAQESSSNEDPDQ